MTVVDFAFAVILFGLALIVFIGAVGLIGMPATALVDWMDERKRKNQPAPDLFDPDLLESVDSKASELLLKLQDPTLIDRIDELERWLSMQVDAHQKLEEVVDRLEKDCCRVTDNLDDRIVALEADTAVEPTLCEDCDDAGSGDCLHPDFCSLKSEPVRVHTLEEWTKCCKPTEGFGCGTVGDPAEWQAYTQSDPLADKGEGKTEPDKGLTPNQKDSEQESV